MRVIVMAAWALEAAPVSASARERARTGLPTKVKARLPWKAGATPSTCGSVVGLRP